MKLLLLSVWWAMFCTGSTKISPRGQEAKASSQTPPRPLILEPVSWQVSETLRRRHRCLFQISALTTFIFSSLCFSYWSSNFIYLSILSTLAPSHVLPGDGTPVCSRHRAVFLCAERPAALSEGPEERQGHMEPRLLGQTGVMRAASLNLSLDSQPHHPQQAALEAAGKLPLRR